jgi:hypothetical protein
MISVAFPIPGNESTQRILFATDVSVGPVQRQQVRLPRHLRRRRRQASNPLRLRLRLRGRPLRQVLPQGSVQVSML